MKDQAQPRRTRSRASGRTKGEQPEGEPPFSTELGRYAVTLDSSPNRNIVIATMTGSQLLMRIQAARQVDVFAELKAGGGTGAMIGMGSHVFDPAPGRGGDEPVTNGVFIGATIALTSQEACAVIEPRPARYDPVPRFGDPRRTDPGGVAPLQG